MKGQTLEDVLKIIEKQQIQIEQLEKQVSCLLSRDTNGNNSDNKMINGVVSKKNMLNGNHPGSEDKGGMSLENRVLELEVISQSTAIQRNQPNNSHFQDVVLEMKGDMIELMMVYQDIQDKLYDIDRSWQNSLVFHNVKQVTDIEWLFRTLLYNDTFQDSASVCSYESSECTEVRLRDLLRSALNIRSHLIKEKRKTPEPCYFQARHSVYAGVEDLQWTGH